MEAEDRIGLGILEHPSFNISFAPDFLPEDGVNRLDPSSAGWKMNSTVPGKLILDSRQHLGTAISIAVWASCPQACMRSTSLPRYWCLAFGRERQPLRLLHGQGVHVGAQGHGRAGLRPLQDAHDAGPGDAGPHLQPQAPQVLGHHARRPGLLVTELRMLVDVPAPADQLALDRSGLFPDRLLQGRASALPLFGLAIDNAAARAKVETYRE